MLDALRRRGDVLLTFDPGLNQLLIAVGAIAGIGAALGSIYLLMQGTHILWIEPSGRAALKPAMLAQLDAQHHGETLLAMLLGGIVGMLSAFAVLDTKPRALTITMALVPIPMLVTMALAIQFLNHRTLGILVMAVVMAGAVYAPKFSPRIGPRAFLFGLMLFIGYLFGFLSHGAIRTSDLGWIAVILWVAVAVNLVLKLVVFLPLARGALRRSLRSFFAHSRRAITYSARLFSIEDPRQLARARRRLHRRLSRLNETALIVDGLLGQHPEIAQEIHGRVFQAELAVQNIGRLADALGDVELPDELRVAIRESLLEAHDTWRETQMSELHVLRASGRPRTTRLPDPLTAGRVLRLADELESWQLATRLWRDVELAGVVDPVPFETPVTLMFGNLPGSALVGRSAAAPPGSIREKLRLDFPAQSAIRLGIAVVAAASLGSVVSERRFYWAVLAVFVSFMGTNTSGEQLIKAAQRVGGTVVGILIGTLLANAIGVSSWSIAVILGALFLGVYLMRASYALMVLGITIVVSQLYMQLGEYTNHLLVLRLEETAIGAAVAALAAFLIFPIHARQAARVAAHEYYAQLGGMLDRLIQQLSGETVSLSLAGRSLDSTAHALRSAALPLTWMPSRRSDIEHNLLLFTQAAHYARNLAADVATDRELDHQVRHQVIATLRAQQRLIDALERRLGELTVLGGKASASASSHAHCALTHALRHQSDLLPVTLEAGASSHGRRVVRHLLRLVETLAELGDNLIGGDDSDRRTVPRSQPFRTQTATSD